MFWKAVNYQISEEGNDKSDLISSEYLTRKYIKKMQKTEIDFQRNEGWSQVDGVREIWYKVDIKKVEDGGLKSYGHVEKITKNVYLSGVEIFKKEN